ncbi:MAG TPA: GAF and ANTAR domain-containing protein [Nocardioidaceae bacterium]|nr:GAF and ANTAR domain-containing protein [Nocardioidaceae bacterium]
MAPELNLREFAELAQSLQSAPTPTETAEQVLGFAVQQLDADHGSITLTRRGGRLETITATDPLVERIDALQAELNEGICRDKSWLGDALLVTDLRSDTRWRRWSAKVADLGMASLLAVEITSRGGRPAGSINLYWRQPRTFDADDVAFANIFARHAAWALSTSLEIAELNVALDGRKLIGQAQGILMERHGLDAPRAFEVLRRYSQDHNLKLRQVAEYLVNTRELPPADPPVRDGTGNNEPDLVPEPT